MGEREGDTAGVLTEAVPLLPREDVPFEDFELSWDYRGEGLVRYLNLLNLVATKEFELLNS